jgi:hypothetical protein
VKNQIKYVKSGFNDFSNLSKFRRFGSPGALPENPRVGSSILSLGTKYKKPG